MKAAGNPSIGIMVSLLLAVFALSGGLTYWNIRRLDGDAHRVIQVHEITELAHEELMDLVDVGSRQRDFMFTGNEEYLAAYAKAIDQSNDVFVRLMDATQSQPEQQARIQQLKEKAQARRVVLEKGIALRRQDADAATGFVMARRGKLELDAIRQVVDRILSTERDFLLQSELRRSSTYAIAVVTGSFTTVLGLLLVAALGWQLRRNREIDLAQRQVEEALRESEGRFRGLADHMSQLAWIADGSGSLFWYNQRWFDYTGTTLELMRGWGWRSVHHPDFVDQIAERWSRHIAEGAPFDETFQLRGADGCYRWFLTRATPFRDDKGVVVRWFGTNTDITELRVALGERDAAQAVQASLLQRERRTLERLQALSKASLKIHAGAQFGHVIATVAEEARTLIPCRRATAMSLTGRGLSERFESVSASEDGESAPWSGADDLQRQLGDVDRPLRLSAAELQARLGPQKTNSPAYPPLGGWLSVPLIGREGHLLGRIQLQDALDGEFSADDEALLVQLANVTTVALENSQLYSQLRETDRRKDEFLATLAHELRNPLAPLRSAVEVLQIKGEKPMLDRFLPMMKRQVDHMVRLIDDLLEVSRISRGDIVLKNETVELADILNNAIESVKPEIDRSQHRLTIDRPPRPLKLVGDAVRLGQVFVNLLNNASKYTAPGGILTVRVEVENADVVVTVADNGVGIPPSMLPRVFDMFVQIDRDLRGAQKGLGIGLAIVKRLVEMHSGTVEVRSPGPDQGSQFIVRLPLHRETEATLEPIDVPIMADGIVRRLPGPILIVDDNCDAADSLSSLLRLQGVGTRVSYDGHSALLALRDWQPALALIDIGMPGMSGLELAHLIRAETGWKGIRLIALTGWSQNDDRERVLEAGFDGHLVKPVDFQDLAKLLELTAKLSDRAPNAITG